MNVTVFVPKELEKAYKLLQQAAANQRVGVMKYVLTEGNFDFEPGTHSPTARPGPNCPWCSKPLDIVVTKKARKPQDKKKH